MGLGRVELPASPPSSVSVRLPLFRVFVFLKERTFDDLQFGLIGRETGGVRDRFQVPGVPAWRSPNPTLVPFFEPYIETAKERFEQTQWVQREAMRHYVRCRRQQAEVNQVLSIWLRGPRC